jgi:hypothetical protein
MPQSNYIPAVVGHGMRHFNYYQIWRRENPLSPAREASDMALWVGKILPCDISPNTDTHYDECDCCGKYFHFDNLFTFGAQHGDDLNIDWEILEILHWDHAYGACADCLEKLEIEMQAILSKSLLNKVAANAAK